jgi:hypothetical protein
VADVQIDEGGSGDLIAAPEDDAAPAEDAEPEAADSPDERRLFRLVLALTLLPLAVSAVVLFVAVRPGYLPTSDWALIEMQVRDVGKHEVLHGLYSREDWSHPGPMFAYLAAPVYRLLGSTPVAVNFVTLIINGAAIAAMAFIARRLGGRGPMLATLVAAALLMRTLGAETVRDPWNEYVTVLPFGLMIFLTWAMLCRETWALPAGVFVASFLAQAHVGFVLLAMPLLLLGAGGLVLTAWHAGPRGGADRRALRRPALLSAGLLAFLWLPTAYDVVANGRGSNPARIVRYFRHAQEATHSLADGWGVVTGQFALPPEWATRALGPLPLSGDDRHQYVRPTPWLLALLAVGAVVLWRRARPNGPRLVVPLVVTLAVGIVAVVRTIGPAFYYRLHWAWIPPAVAFVVVGWAGWLLVERRWPERGARVLTAAAVAVLVALASVNSVTAITTETHAEADGGVVAALLPPLLDDIAGKDGTVLITDAFTSGAWYSRGMVLELERQGIDVKVPAADGALFGSHRVYRGGPLAGEYVVTRDQYIERLAKDPNLELVAQWSPLPPDELARISTKMNELDDELQSGQIDMATYFYEYPLHGLETHSRATYYAAAVFRVRDPGLTPAAAP